MTPRLSDTAEGRWGAVDLSARVFQLCVDDAIFDHGLTRLAVNAGRATAVKAGMKPPRRRAAPRS
jgi:hypothetical protein